jgi:hypothetical protein
MAKRVAFRNDYCLACGEARRAVQVETSSETLVQQEDGDVNRCYGIN